MHILTSVFFRGFFFPESEWLAEQICEWTCTVHQSSALLMCWRNVLVSGNRVACAVVHTVPLGKKMFWHRADFWCHTCTALHDGSGTEEGRRILAPTNKSQNSERLQMMMEMCCDANEPKRVDAGDKLHSDQRCDLGPDKQTDKPASLGSEWKEWASPFALFQSSIQPQSLIGPVVRTTAGKQTVPFSLWPQGWLSELLWIPQL